MFSLRQLLHPQTLRSPRDRGFTFVEMLVAMSLSAAFIGTAALVLSAITLNAKHFSTIESLTLGAAITENFYGVSSGTVRTPAAPNLGRIGFANEMKDQFHEDLTYSEGVYCLARSVPNTIRPEWLEWPYSDPATEKPVLDSPEAFRQYLVSVESAAASIFSSYRNVPPASAPNTSIFMIAPTDQPEHLKVQAVYEIDYQTLSDPNGVYASVRRYKNGTLTHYYDIFFETGDEAFLTPSVVAFESRSRLAKAEGASIDRFKIAPAGPFYLVWWPDPSVNPMKTPTVTKPTDTAEPLEAYGHLAGKTGYVITAPLFPSL